MAQKNEANDRTERLLRRRQQQLWPKIMKGFNALDELVSEYQEVHEQLHGGEEVPRAAQTAGAT